MNKKHFIRKIEDFVCEHCGTKVKGTGYTNHCPNCLYSKHVDLEIPGDRAANCGGLMKPVGVDLKHGEHIIIHKCLKCGKITRNKTSPEDNFEKILKLSAKPLPLKVNKEKEE